MINEVEAAIHHCYRFRLARGRAGPSATRFAHKSAVLGRCETQEIKPHNPFHQLYADIFCHSLTTFCSMGLLIKTGIWWWAMIHVRMKLHWSDDQWYELIYVKSPHAATVMEGRVMNKIIDGWLKSWGDRRRRIDESQRAVWHEKEMESERAKCYANINYITLMH